jgi:hypothetical protein
MSKLVKKTAKETFDGKNICCLCKDVLIDGNYTSFLQCGHYVHVKCSAEKLVESYGDWIDVLKFDKNKLIRFKENEVGIIHFVDDQNFATFVCDVDGCDSKYTFLSYISRMMRIPKKILGIVRMVDHNFSDSQTDNAEPKYVYHHICTIFDIIHYMSGSYQKHYFGNNDMDTEYSDEYQDLSDCDKKIADKFMTTSHNELLHLVIKSKTDYPETDSDQSETIRSETVQSETDQTETIFLRSEKECDACRGTNGYKHADTFDFATLCMTSSEQ